MRRLTLYALSSLGVLWNKGALGALFVTSPFGGITCHGGQPCTVEWLDDGRQPLLNAIGPSTIALYNQEKTLVQQIAAAQDVSATRSLTFTPNPEAGPNSSSYFIWITSLNEKDPNNTNIPYMSFSGRFTIDDMLGEANAPVPSLTSSLPLTASGSTPPSSTSNGVVSTTTLPFPPGVTPTASVPAGSSTTLTAFRSTFTINPSQATSLTSGQAGTRSSSTLTSGASTGTIGGAAGEQNNSAKMGVASATFLIGAYGLLFLSISILY